MDASEIIDTLLQAPTTRAAAVTDGEGAPRIVRAREGEGGGDLAPGADIAASALAEFARRQGCGEPRLTAVVCSGATVVLHALRDGGVLAVVADPEANLGMLLNTCKTAAAAWDRRDTAGEEA